MASLLTAAEHEFSTLPRAVRQPHWRSTLTRLDEARIGLENTLALWEDGRDALPANAVPGTEAYDEPLAERNGEAWSYLCDWADCGPTLLRIARAAAPDLGAAGPSPQHSQAQGPVAPPPGHPNNRGPR